MCVINAFRRKEIENLKNEIIRLEKEEGCLKIECNKCKYLAPNGRKWTCKRIQLIARIKRLEKKLIDGQYF